MVPDHYGLRERLVRSPEQAPRETRRVLVRTSDGVEIEGLAHIPPGARTLDFLNCPAESFLAITGATIRVSDRVERSEFVAVNKAHITVLRELGDRP
jgi:hypothetical protein